MLGMWISMDPARQFASPYLYAGNGYNPVNGVDPNGNVLNDIGMKIYNSLVALDFFGSSILKDDWNYMVNSEDLITMKYSPNLTEGQSYVKLNIIEFPSQLKNSLYNLAIMGRHEGDHLKGVFKAGWHESPGDPKEGLEPGIHGSGIWGVNNAIRENSLPEDHPAYGKEYDPIYGRDYDAIMETGNWFAEEGEL